MFGMGFWEISVILVVAVIALGPEKLPGALVEIAKYFKIIKKSINDAKSTFDQEVRIAELKEDAKKYKESISETTESMRKKLTFEELDEIKGGLNSVKDTLNSGLSDIENSVKNVANETENSIKMTKAQIAPNASATPNDGVISGANTAQNHAPEQNSADNASASNAGGASAPENPTQNSKE